jgi:Arc/MetJ family transcription regulator
LLVREARKLTGLATKREMVYKALKLLVRSESHKGVLRYLWNGAREG